MGLRSGIVEAVWPANYKVRYPQRMVGRPLLYASSASASLGDALLGFSQGITAVFQVQPSFIQRMFGIKVTIHQIKDGTTGIHRLPAAILIASASVTAILGALASAYALERLGRRFSIRTGAILFFIASCIQMIAPNLATLIVGRGIQGFGAGIISTSVPVFQVEIAPADARGILVGIEAFCMNAGYAASTWVGYAFFLNAHADRCWRGPYAVQAVVSLVLILWTFFLPESPRWLIQKGFMAEGLRTLADLHAGGDIKDEGANLTYHSIVDTLEMEKQRFGDGESAVAPWLRLLQSYPRRSRIGLTARMFAQLNGINAILHFLPEHLAQAGFDIPLALFYAGLASIVNCLGTLPAILFVEKLGRRRLLLVGSSALACSLLYVDRWPRIGAYIGGAHGVFIGVSVYLFFFGATYVFSSCALCPCLNRASRRWGPVPWLLSAELFPLRMRARGMSITTACDWFFETVVTVATPALSAALSSTRSSYFYFLLAGACALSGLVVWRVYIETGGRPLEAVGGMFGDPLPAPLRIENEDALLQIRKLHVTLVEDG
ncbi:general substrate transporter [Mycena pura]|uniref:General substrate transporter n=1 Tax=Mycena pura TaxID=153505 RepID=A0AAD6YHE0_9AGAR|nr:general substrate transporter [Mycena pura]